MLDIMSIAHEVATIQLQQAFIVDHGSNAVKVRSDLREHAKVLLQHINKHLDVFAASLIIYRHFILLLVKTLDNVIGIDDPAHEGYLALIVVFVVIGSANQETIASNNNLVVDRNIIIVVGIAGRCLRHRNHLALKEDARVV
jgi:hypothetical protein